MKKSFPFSAAAVAITLSTMGTAQASLDDKAAAGPVALGGPVNVGFSEVIDNTLTHTTDQVHSIDRGIQAATLFTVDKFIHNISNYNWTDFHVQLQTLQGGRWVNSGDGDGVSFGDIEDIASFLGSATVDINGVVQSTPWTLTRNTTTDVLDYGFVGFTVKPGDTLSLHFDMSDNLPADNTWRLVQVASIPEPSTVVLMGLGLAGLGVVQRRKAR